MDKGGVIILSYHTSINVRQVPRNPVASLKTPRTVDTHPTLTSKTEREHCLLSGRSPTDTSELWPELAAGGTLLLPVLVTVATGSTVGTVSSTSGADTSRARGTNGTLVGCRDDLRWEMEPTQEQ